MTAPKGFVLHGTRSGQASYSTAYEYSATVNYVKSGAGGLGWHITCADDLLAVHMAADQYGYHARAASAYYLACEFAQATADKPISDAQVNAFCWWVQNLVLPAWPQIPMVFKTHAELEQSGETGARDGKTDCFPAGDPRADELRARIRARLGL